MKSLFIAALFLVITINLSAQNNSLNETRYKSAQSLERVGQYEKAKAVYFDLVNIEPGNPMYAESLNKMYIQLKQYHESISFLENRLKLYPQDISLYGLLGITYYLTDKRDMAYEIWDSALSLIPSQPSNYKLIASYVIECRDFEKALEILNLGKKQTHDARIYAYDLANLYSLTMEFGKAAEEFCSLLVSSPEQINLVKNRMNGYLSRHSAANQSLEVIRKYAEDKDLPVYWDLLNYVYMQIGEYANAFEAVKKFDAKSSKNGAQLFTFAQLAMRSNQYEIATEAYNLLFDKYPASPFIFQAKINYVNGLEEILNNKIAGPDKSWKPFNENDTTWVNEYETVIGSYTRLVTEANQADIKATAKMRIGSIFFERLNRINEAEKIFNEVINNYPITQAASVCNQKLGQIYLQKGDKDKATVYFQKVISNKRSEPELQNYAKFKLAQINFWQGNYPAALIGLANVTADLSDDNANNALELAMIISTFKNDSLNLSSFAEAEFLVEQKNYSDAIAIYKTLSEDKNLFILNSLSKFKMAQMDIALNNYSSAIAILEKISNDEENKLYSDKALFLLGNTYRFGIKDLSKANEAYKKFLEKFPNSLYFDKVRESINVINTEVNKPI
ncbi:MAG: tetratricopeptide repeat protein [bacterium]